MLFVAALIGFISLIGGLLVLNSENLDTLDESIWWAFLRLTDPGYLGDDEGFWKRLISTIITIAGYVLFLGSLVAIITTWLNRKIRDLEKGYTPVTANNHIIILGWTNRTVHIAGELFQSHGKVKKFLRYHKTRRIKLIILSEDVGHSRLTELKENDNIGSKANDIVLRSGDSIDREHLRRVDILNASTIIIPSYTTSSDELLTPDVETIKTLLSINAEVEMSAVQKFPFVVAEIQDENKIKAARRAYKGPLEIISSDTIISRLISQNIRHSGLNEVYNEILARSIKSDLFTRHFPGFAGKPVYELKNYFPKAIVAGVVAHVEDQYNPQLNVAADYVLTDNDRIILLANKYDDTEPVNVAKPIDTSPKNKLEKKLIKKKKINHNKKILILGWNHKVPPLIHEFANYKDESYHIDIVSLRPIDLRKKAMEILNLSRKNLTHHHIEADYVKEAEMLKIAPDQYDHIIFVSTDKLEQEEEADARTIVGFILLEEILSQSAHQPKIFIELADPSNESMMKRFNRDVIVSPMILSHMLTQVALQRELFAIYDQLFTIGGPEITFRDPAEYGIDTNEISFAEVEHYASIHQETAIGLYTSGGKLLDDDFHLMNPPRDYKIQLDRGIQVIVITSAG